MKVKIKKRKKPLSLKTLERRQSKANRFALMYQHVVKVLEELPAGTFSTTAIMNMLWRKFEELQVYVTFAYTNAILSKIKQDNHLIDFLGFSAGGKWKWQNIKLNDSDN